VSAGPLLVTGFPGFLGARLVASLVQRDTDARVIALVESSMADKARQTAGGLDGGERIEVLAGDITDSRLGVDDDDYGRLTGQVSAVFHLAAVYDLAVPLEVAQTVNVEGTGNVLDFCARAESLTRLNYVSTAFVAGLREGVVYEHELALGQGFKNHYESTKFQAEMWVRHAMQRIPTTIYRPAIVVGDSKTGETAKFDGPYYLLRMISRLRRGRMPLAQVGSDAPFNVVPVDLVVDGITSVSDDPDSIGETLHLVDPEPLSSRELFEALAEEYADRRPKVVLPPAAMDATLRLGPMRRALDGIPRESLIYLTHGVRFDARRAGELLDRHGLRCPRLREYLPTLVEFFRAHEDDPTYT
jgi:thioester reductase-like protein